MSETLREQLTVAARSFLDALDDDRRARAQYLFEPGGERERWFYTPTDHGGLSLRDMTSAQQREAHRLLGSSLSQRGYVTTATIMGLDNILDLQEEFSWPLQHGQRPRDPLGYSVSIFGEPGGEQPWGWRFGGHHVSLNYFVSPEGIRTLPSFFGANPARSRGTGANVMRPLGAEEDLGRELVHLLTPQQRERAVISPVAPPDMVTLNRSVVSDGDQAGPATPIWRGQSINPNAAGAVERAVAFLGLTPAHLEMTAYTTQPKGIALADMNEGQRQAARALLHQYLDRMPEEIAEAEMVRLDDASVNLHFAWAGGIERGLPYYYRLQGDGLIVEHDNTQNAGNHIHTVWRDPRRDFGRDLLAEHYAHEHAHAQGRPH